MSALRSDNGAISTYRRAAIVVRMATLAVGALGIVIVASQDLFPARYSADSEKIQAIAQGAQSGHGDKAFEFIAGMYDLLGLEGSPIRAGLLGFISFVMVLLAVVRVDQLEEADLLTVATLGSAVILASLYLGQYSKDVLLLFVTLIAGTGRRGRGSRELATIVAILSVAVFVRSYWVIILGIYLCIRWAYSQKWKPRSIALGLLATYGVLAILFGLFLGQDLNYGRASVNAFRIDLNVAVNTMIVDPFEMTGFFGGILNSLAVGVALVLPFPLAAAGSYYLMIAVLVAAMWISTGRVAIGFASRTEMRDPLLERSLALLLAMLVTQSLFEPDYGSYVRHLTPLMPLIVLVSTRYRQLIAAEVSP